MSYQIMCNEQAATIVRYHEKIDTTKCRLKAAGIPELSGNRPENERCKGLN
jgi:hypothetical protein